MMVCNKVSILNILFCFALCASEEDLLKKLEKEVKTIQLDDVGIQQYQNFIQQMRSIVPDQSGNRRIGYIVEQTKRKKERVVIDGVDHVSLKNDTFEVFKGFQLTSNLAIFISRDLQEQKFEAQCAAIQFLNCINKIFDQAIGRIQIPLPEEDAVITFWQSRSKKNILGCVHGKNGLPKPLEK